MQEDYRKELENYNALWSIFARNSLNPEFRKSLYSALALVFLPSGVNIYYIFRVSVLKNMVRLTSIMSCFILFHYNLNRDFEQFLRMDTKDSNQAKTHIQNISATNVIFPYFKEETLEILQKRQ